MKTIDEMVEVMTGYKNGEALEYCELSNPTEWHTCRTPDWDWSKCDYRFRKENRPYANYDEMVKDYKCRFNVIDIEPLIWIYSIKDSQKYLITGANYNVVNASGHWYTLEQLFKRFTYYDFSSVGMIHEDLPEPINAKENIKQSCSTCAYGSYVYDRPECMLGQDEVVICDWKAKDESIEWIPPQSE